MLSGDDARSFIAVMWVRLIGSDKKMLSKTNIPYIQYSR
jgi:hypothetical protein